LFAGRLGASVAIPAIVIRPILFTPGSVNQSAPSGPAVIPAGLLPGVAVAKAVTPTGGGGNWAIWLLPARVTQRLPSGPVTIPVGLLPAARSYCTTVGGLPTGIRPTLSAPFSANQIAPSGPAVIPAGFAPAVGTGTAVKAARSCRGSRM